MPISAGKKSQEHVQLVVVEMRGAGGKLQLKQMEDSIDTWQLNRSDCVALVYYVPEGRSLIGEDEREDLVADETNGVWLRPAEPDECKECIGTLLPLPESLLEPQGVSHRIPSRGSVLTASQVMNTQGTHYEQAKSKFLPSNEYQKMGNGHPNAIKSPSNRIPESMPEQGEKKFLPSNEYRLPRGTEPCTLSEQAKSKFLPSNEFINESQSKIRDVYAFKGGMGGLSTGHPIQGKAITAYFANKDAVAKAAAYLGIPHECGEGHVCVLPNHQEHKAALWQGNNGVYVYHCFEHKRFYKLPELCLAKAKARQGNTDEYKACTDIELAIWGIRLLLESSVIPMPLLHAAPLPESVSQGIKQLYDGFILRVAVSMVYSGRLLPVAFSQRFASTWCGVSEWDAKTGLGLLKEHGYMVAVDSTRSRYGKPMQLFLPAVLRGDSS
jgi:hypothetical protein